MPGNVTYADFIDKKIIDPTSTEVRMTILEDELLFLAKQEQEFEDAIDLYGRIGAEAFRCKIIAQNVLFDIRDRKRMAKQEINRMK